MGWSRRTLWRGLLLGVVLIGVAALPVAWAMPETYERLQTVPTRTPVSPPTTEPPPPPPPPDTPVPPPPDTPVPDPPNPPSEPEPTMTTAPVASDPTEVVATQPPTPSLTQSPTATPSATVEPAEITSTARPVAGSSQSADPDSATPAPTSTPTPRSSTPADPTATPSPPRVEGDALEINETPAQAVASEQEPPGAARTLWLLAGGGLVLVLGVALLILTRR